MNKNPKIISLSIFLMLVITVIIGVNLQPSNNEFTSSGECTLRNNLCIFKDAELTLQVEFNQVPIVEEELFITLSISNKAKVSKAWIEGINMYMGKTPVLFSTSNIKSVNSDKLITQGITFLGSCSQPVMQWRLFIEVEQQQKTHKVYSVLFTTSP